MLRKIHIPTHKIALLLRKEDLLKVLRTGTHWIRTSDTVHLFSLRYDVAIAPNLEWLLEDERVTDLIDTLEVQDNELALEYREGNLNRVLRAGRYYFWKEGRERDFRILDRTALEVPTDLYKQNVRTFLNLYVRVHQVESFEQGVLFVDSKFERMLAPGTYYFWNNERTVSVLKADLRRQEMEISGQEILTKDKAALRINFYTFYRIVDVQKALVDTKNMPKQLYTLMQLGLRSYVGTLTLDELLAKKEDAEKFVLETTRERAAEMGVELMAAGIRDLILPGEVKAIMNQVLVAQKKAQANTIMRREETASTRSLLNTAKLMEENEMLFKLKEMEYVEKIADKINTISINGGTRVAEQLRDLFSPCKEA